MMQSQLFNQDYAINQIPSMTIEDYIFDNQVELPQGNWEVHIIKGDAWIFSNQGNFILHAGETTIITESDGVTQLKRLYTKGMVKFVASHV